ncbi:MAG: hypothetical protein Q8930_20240 [Bacillota bacterium]|nr:hypothetical protein [Bacillota bacterium]
MKSIKREKNMKRFMNTDLNLPLVSGAGPANSFAPTTDIWPGYPGGFGSSGMELQLLRTRY